MQNRIHLFILNYPRPKTPCRSRADPRTASMSFCVRVVYLVLLLSFPHLEFFIEAFLPRSSLTMFRFTLYLPPMVTLNRICVHRFNSKTIIFRLVRNKFQPSFKNYFIPAAIRFPINGLLACCLAIKLSRRMSP